MSSFLSRFSISQMITGLILLIVSIFGFYSYYSLGKASAELERQVEGTAKSQLNTVGHEIVSVFEFYESLWSAFIKSPITINSLKGSNEVFSQLADPKQQIVELDKQWREVPAGKTSALMDGLLGNDFAVILRNRLSEFSDKDGFDVFAEVFVTNSYGGNIAQTSRTTDYDQSDEEWWQQTKKVGRHLSDIQFDDSSGVSSVDLSLRIVDIEDKFLGVIKIVVNFQDIAQRMNLASERIRESSDNTLVLLNAKNQIAHKTGEAFEALSNGSAYLDPFKDNSNLAEHQNEAGDKNLMSLKSGMSEIDSSYPLPWTLILTLDKDKVYNVSNKLRKDLLFVGSLITLGALTLAGLALLTIKRKFSRVSKAAMDLASGNFETRVNATGKDEIAKLGNTFDLMAGEIEKMTDDLENRRVWAEETDQRRRITLAAARVIEFEFNPKTHKLKLPINWRSELGLQSISASGQTFFDHSNRDDYEEFIDSLHNVADGKEFFVEKQIRIQEAGEEDSWLLARGQKVDLAKNTVGGVLLNISGQKELEQRLSQVNRLESIGQLSAGIAHEINTPMQYIGDNLEFLKKACERIVKYGQFCEETLVALSDESVPEEIRTVVDEKKKELRIEKIRNRVPTAIDDSLDGVVAVSRIIRAMKDFSHLDNDKKTDVDVNKVLNSALNVSKSEWKYVADIETNLDESISSVPAYAGELNQVFLNIVVNAAHALEETLGPENRKGLIIIESKDNLAKGTVDVTISDNGPGIPEDVRERIFDQFFTTKEVGKGTGQGLSICRSIIKNRHGGDIKVESEVGEGTSFTISLPLNAKEEDDQEST